MRTLVCWILLAATAQAGGVKIAVTGGGVDLKDVPVSAELPAAAAMDGVKFLKPEGSDGGPIPCQVIGSEPAEVHFVVPELKAGQTRVFVPAEADSRPTGFTSQKRDGEYLETRHGERVVARYVCRPFDDSTAEKRFMSYKPFHHLFDPEDGDTRLTRGPEDGADKTFPHHRGMFFGFNKVTYGDNKADVWHCRGDDHQRHEEFLGQESGPVLDRMTAKITWRGKGQKPFAEERRQVTFFAVPGATLTEFAAELRPTEGVPIKLDGDPQHAGFQFRAIEEVASKTSKQTYYLRPDGKGKPGETRNWPGSGDKSVDLPWNAVSFVVGGQRYTVVYLDHPDNPKPARHSERDYARFGSYFEATVTDQDPLNVRYRLWIQRGEMTVEECERLSRAFVSPPEVSVTLAD